MFHTGFVAFCVNHTVYGEVCTIVTQKFDVVKISEPICIVYDERFVIGKINKAFCLFFEALHVVVDLFDGHDTTHVATAGWVANHPGAATGQENWTVTVLLHVLHDHELNIVAHVQAICGWVKADIESNLLLTKKLTGFIRMGGLFDVATFSQHIIDVSFH